MARIRVKLPHVPTVEESQMSKRLEFGPDGGRKAFYFGLLCFVIIGFLLGLAWPAGAQTITCLHGRGAFACSLLQPRSHITHVPGPETAQEAAARDIQIAKWESFCKPAPRIDAYGVTRYVYAHQGCDLGRSE